MLTLFVFLSLKALGTYVLPVTTIIALLGTIWFTRGFISGTKLHGQLTAKDEIIRTNEQSITALERRLATLEGDFKGMVAENNQLRSEVDQLRKELADSRSRYDELRKISDRYAAPEAVARFEAQLTANYNKLEAIFAKLQHLETRVHDKLNASS